MIFALALVGKLFITGSYGLLYLVSSELFPTSVRSRGLNLSSMMARFGSIMSPFIIKLLVSCGVVWCASVVLCCLGSSNGAFISISLICFVKIRSNYGFVLFLFCDSCSFFFVKVFWMLWWLLADCPL